MSEIIKCKKIRRSVYLGSVGTIGQTEAYSNSSICVKPLGKWYQKSNIKKMEMASMNYVDVPEFDPISNEETGEIIRVYLFDLKNYDQFIYKDNAPQEIVMKVNTLKQENKYLQSQNSKLKELLRRKGIRSMEIDDHLNEMEYIKKANTTPSGMQQPMIQQNK